ncbi:CDP-archaeol synthase [Gallibacterium anatis]|uniref:Phosphatidate cytidylyltransferase n=2 Tax=Gallibacterium anatis TaxID=750 RepID=A0A0A3A0J3_9PAST|nr:CDP-archaeol synthase [Gallibacterium anatis]KGQ26038.1 phosphatidate cytidylyltransferase [Gallibacterium anatis CCM5995]KGQ28027.1 phosphatidate cytidylyltransferase [Gallibacterium anatis]KGQ28191.1 phosphatidate cytidylyltransferase [Gallibacterium anatis]KGQ40814.1 phosphatidate cytidylyltransferase [Gallibacterium anatis IPDH697-78]KGQ44404.1 phosphatidate cytidylyltransferase [Gallibacterium anatis]
MLKARILSALVLVGIVFIVLFVFPPLLFACTVALLVTLAVWEWTQFAKIKQPLVRLIITTIAAAFLYLFLYANSDYISGGNILNNVSELLIVSSLVWWIIAFCLVLSYPKSTAVWGNSSIAQLLFAFFTLVPFFLSLMALRFYHYNSNPYQGIVLLLYVFLLVWAADTGAYFAGRKFGKHKLAPKVSPGKTWQGAIGGVLLSAVVACIFLSIAPFYQQSNLSFFQLIALSVLTVFVSILGDLSESMFKRHCGIKDSSQLIPGHGGIMDRIDSLTAALPVFSAFFFVLN